LPKLLLFIVQSADFQRELQRYIKGIIGGINLDVKNIKIPVPPPEIQLKIVSELDGYIAQINEAKVLINSSKLSTHAVISRLWSE